MLAIVAAVAGTVNAGVQAVAASRLFLPRRLLKPAFALLDHRIGIARSAEQVNDFFSSGDRPF
jgi:hypothetical protein